MGEWEEGDFSPDGRAEPGRKIALPIYSRQFRGRRGPFLDNDLQLNCGKGLSCRRIKQIST